MPRNPRALAQVVLVWTVLGWSLNAGAQQFDDAPRPPGDDDRLAAPNELPPEDVRYAPTEPSAPLAEAARSLRLPPVKQPSGGVVRLASDFEPQPGGHAEGDGLRRLPLNPRQPTSRTRLGGDVNPLISGAASLGIVLGLFMLVAWVVRRGMPRTVSALPLDAVEILGRAPLVGRQQVHLLRCGNKLLLVCVSASSVETLTEITDPDEVERLTELCQQPPGVAASFRQVFQQFSKQSRGVDYLNGRSVDDLDFGQLDDLAHHSHRESSV